MIRRVNWRNAPKRIDITKLKNRQMKAAAMKKVEDRMQKGRYFTSNYSQLDGQIS